VIKSMSTQSLNRIPYRYAWRKCHIRKDSYEFDSRPCEQSSWSFKWFHSLPPDNCWGRVPRWILAVPSYFGPSINHNLSRYSV